jgi:Zn-dependent peptidase ImmA (M78 family)
MENEANAFAAEFLMPANEIRQNCAASTGNLD